jgi:hypothetical protein
MKKIALCFLTIDNLSQPELWSRIINKNKDKLNVYIHNKVDFVDEEYGLHNYCIKNRIETEWGKKTLVQATLNLFRTAFTHDNNNEFFILLSDTCIPLYNFDYIYKTINNINTNIIYSDDLENSIHNNNLHDPFFFNAKHINRFKNLVNPYFFKIYLKHSQWVLLKRNTAYFFINKNFLYNYKYSFFAVDEHYFANICNKYKFNYLNQRITFVNWRKNNKPETYYFLNNDIVEEIKKTECLFMRKVPADCKLPSYFDTIS